jgi:hypothetical protein
MQDIKRGLAPVREATTLQAFLQASGYDVNPDGTFGPGTEAALVKFQREHGLIADGVAGEKTWTTLFSLHPQLLSQMSAQWLSQQDIDDFAAQTDLEVPLVRTVYGVESGGAGFVGTKAKILFEGHLFWSELQAAGIDPKSRAAGNEDILFPKWNPKSYVGGLAEYGRLERAMAIAEAPALRAASWGLFQILGQHAESLGFADVKAFVAAMQSREAAHLAAFGGFIKLKRFKGRPLIEHLRNHDWAAFAEGYNGSGFKTNSYDTRLAEAYEKYAAMAP